MNHQYVHNALTSQKLLSLCIFLVVKTEETFSCQDQNLWKQPICDDNFLDKKLPQSKSATATIAIPVELMNGIIMNTSSCLN